MLPHDIPAVSAETACHERLDDIPRVQEDNLRAATKKESVSDDRDEATRGGVHVRDGHASPAQAFVIVTREEDASNTRRAHVASLSVSLQVRPPKALASSSCPDASPTAPRSFKETQANGTGR
jgi:hypothetical protein